jgi:hypothetical protein
MVAAAVVAVGITGGPFVLPGGLGITGGAEAGVAIPDAITPLAAQASTPYAAMHGCHVAYGATGPASGCVFGDATGRRTVVLLGDSHAAQWFPALSTLAVRERFRLVAWTKSGCPFAPAVNLFLPAIGRGYTECLAWQASVVRQLRALPRPALVILGRISTYLPQVRTADGDVPADGQAPRIWGAGMAAAVHSSRSPAGSSCCETRRTRRPTCPPVCRGTPRTRRPAASRARRTVTSTTLRSRPSSTQASPDGCTPTRCPRSVQRRSAPRWSATSSSTATTTI